MRIKKIASIGVIAIMMSTSLLGCAKEETKEIKLDNEVKTQVKASKAKEDKESTNDKKEVDKKEVDKKDLEKITDEKEKSELKEEKTENKNKAKDEVKDEVSTSEKDNISDEKEEESSSNNENIEASENQETSSKKIILHYYNVIEDYSDVQVIKTDSISPESIISLLKSKGMIESDIIGFKIEEENGLKVGTLNVPKNSGFTGSAARLQVLDNIADTFKDTLGLYKFRLLEDGQNPNDGHIDVYER